MRSAYLCKLRQKTFGKCENPLGVTRTVFDNVAANGKIVTLVEDRIGTSLKSF